MRRWFLVIVGLVLVEAALVVALAFGLTWAGVYDVSADSGHSAPVAVFLHYAMQRSVSTRAAAIRPPPLDDPVRIARGAAYFDIGCALCHGSPDRHAWAGAREMLPAPPPLIGQVPQWQAQELFWIIKHGIKLTAMPSWPVPNRDDEVWDMVAFLERLANLDPAAERELVTAPTGPEHIDHETKRASSDPDLVQTVTVCERCHGPDGRGDALHAFPTISGTPAPELRRALLAYRDGDRPSGFMKTITQNLTTKKFRNWRTISAA